MTAQRIKGLSREKQLFFEVLESRHLLAAAPLVLYTDTLSGTTTGGENDNGSYLSIFGKNFGDPAGFGTTTQVFINDIEVSDYKYIGASKGREDIAQITVQVGSVTSGSIKVVVGGVSSNLDHTFTTRAGDIYYVSLDGNDATGVKNDITKPFRYVQNGSVGGGGVWWESDFGAGDTIVMRGGIWGLDQVGANSRFLTVRNKTGTAANPITLTGFPGEEVEIRSDTKGVINFYRTGGSEAEGLNISNLFLDGSDSIEGLLNINFLTDDLRIVNNELANLNVNAGTAAISGNGDRITILGNSIHDNGNTTKVHGIYIDNDKGNSPDDIDIGYNHLYNQTAGNLIQTFWSSGSITNVSIYNNLIHDGDRYGINIGRNTGAGVEIYNNIIYNTALAGIRFDTSDLVGASVYNNTLYNVNTTVNGGGAVQNDRTFSAGGMAFSNNIVHSASGSYSGSTEGVPLNSTMVGGSRNVWFGSGGAAPSFDTAPILQDPLFADALGHDFSLLSGSPAIDAPGADVLIATDYNGLPRPQGAGTDLGALESGPISSADFDADGDIDGFDFLKWQRGFSTSAPLATQADGDANGDLAVDATDRAIWEEQFGQVVAGAVSSPASAPFSVTVQDLDFIPRYLRDTGKSANVLSVYQAPSTEETTRAELVSAARAVAFEELDSVSSTWLPRDGNQSQHHSAAQPDVEQLLAEELVQVQLRDDLF